MFYPVLVNWKGRGKGSPNPARLFSSEPDWPPFYGLENGWKRRDVEVMCKSVDIPQRNMV